MYKKLQKNVFGEETHLQGELWYEAGTKKGELRFELAVKHLERCFMMVQVQQQFSKFP